MTKTIPLSEVQKHNDCKDCWVAIAGQVYDLTNFAGRHPGGPNIIHKQCGTDATSKFLKFHPTDVIKKLLTPKQHMGALDKKDYKPIGETAEQKQIKENRKRLPSLGQVFNLFDFESLAKSCMTKTAWYYYSSGADDEFSMRENHNAFQRIWFRPRILVDVSDIDISTTFLGSPSNSPFYISATALARLGHPDGETVMTRAAHQTGIIQMLSTLSSCTTEEVAAVLAPGQPLWQQIYVNSDRNATENFIRKTDKLGVTGYFITVDAPQLGRREKDMRTKFDDDLAAVQEKGGHKESQGASEALSTYIDPSLSWKDIPELRKCTDKPMLLKGVQRWEDAVKAYETGLDGIVISNHGGRQLDFSRSSVEVLAEVVPQLKSRGYDSKKFEVFVDGGIRRGSDVVKCLCLGATGVGLGRPFLYAMSTYGVDGVSHAVELLNDEIVSTMRLIGARNLKELGPDLIDSRSLSAHYGGTDYSFAQVYEKPATSHLRPIEGKA